MNGTDMAFPAKQKQIENVNIPPSRNALFSRVF